MIYIIYVQHNITFLAKQKITHTKNRKIFSVSQRKKTVKKEFLKLAIKMRLNTNYLFCCNDKC